MKRSNLLKWWAKMCLLLLPCFALGQLTNEKVEAAFSKFIADSELETATVGFTVVDAITRYEIFSHNGKKSLLPASSLKMITACTALEFFGVHHTFETTLSYTGVIENGVLNGNIVITGGGDPTLGYSAYSRNPDEQLNTWIEAIVGAGIQTINGDIICDASYFSGPTVAPTTTLNNSGNYYAAGSSGLHWRGNKFTITLESDPLDGGDTRITGIDPQLPGIQIINEVKASDINRDMAFIHAVPGSDEMIIHGTIPKGRKAFNIKGALHDPSALLRMEVIRELNRNSIRVSQNLQHVEDETELAKTTSVPLYQIVEHMLKQSDNSVADCLLKHLGKRFENDGSFKGGARSLKKFWGERGVDTKGWFQKDGSGLSRANGVTSQQLALIIAKCRETNVVYIKRGMKHLGDLENVWSKSGYIDRVRAYAGYVEVDGHLYVFSIISNNYSCTASAMRKKIEVLFKAIAK